MSEMHNIAAWLPAVGAKLELRPAPIPEPGQDELLIQTEAVAIQPAEYKIQDGILPFPLTYPTIIGLCFAGRVVKTGPGVTRFQIGDRVVTNSAGTLRNDARFGALQQYALTTQQLTAKIGEASFEKSATLASNLYGAISALLLHLRLDRPGSAPDSQNKSKKILIWGASSSFGAAAVQIAASAGYSVVGVASKSNAALVKSLGASEFVDRTNGSATEALIALGPYHAVLAAADSAKDQDTIGAVLAAQGGGTFLSTMGVRAGVKLPDGVTGFFAQFLDDYLDPANAEFTAWVWWEYLEKVLADGQMHVLPSRIMGGLSQAQLAWDLLRQGRVSAERLIIQPNAE
ncbi:alcohol dehydrogenase [Talaromyces pinophilus]|uniref:Alcohol dehydrogenase n=1 Tax=Talaromyces pinophilus TaxID=128442 RepID=A0A0B8N3U3_TALPI|nr:alcohol dehydrogenase [Talaromyces pinophilus]